MGQEIYSKLGSIPTGYAPDRIVEGCLVLEGGAFRGMYTQGALDAWMQRGLNFQCTLGVSAGGAGRGELRQRPDRPVRPGKPGPPP